MVPVFKNVGERSTAKTATQLVFVLCLVKSLNNRIVDHLNHLLGLLNQLQIF